MWTHTERAYSTYSPSIQPEQNRAVFFKLFKFKQNYALS